MDERAFLMDVEWDLRSIDEYRVGPIGAIIGIWQTSSTSVSSRGPDVTVEMLQERILNRIIRISQRLVAIEAILKVRQ